MALILRVCNKDGSSHNGFKWPMEVGAVVKAPDWRDNKECGNGLHGWLYGQGDHGCTDYWSREGAQWLVVEAETMLDLGGKVKFPECVIRFVGDKKSATDYLWENELRSRDVAVIGAQRSDMRDGAMVMVGALGTATAGDSGVIAIEYYDGHQYYRKIGAIGENGLKANVAYRVENGEFVEACK